MFSDGTIQKVNVEGERTIEFPNGQRETHTKCYKVSRDTAFLFVLETKYLFYNLKCPFSSRLVVFLPCLEKRVP